MVHVLTNSEFAGRIWRRPSRDVRSPCVSKSSWGLPYAPLTTVATTETLQAQSHTLRTGDPIHAHTMSTTGPTAWPSFPERSGRTSATVARVSTPLRLSFYPLADHTSLSYHAGVCASPFDTTGSGVPVDVQAEQSGEPCCFHARRRPRVHRGRGCSAPATMDDAEFATERRGSSAHHWHGPSEGKVCEAASARITLP